MPIKPKLPVYVRAIAMVLLFAMIHYVAGYRLMYSLGILYAKEEAKAGMVEKTHNIKKLTLTASDYNSLKWTEENKEFSFNNEMYDVVSMQKTENAYVITVYCDDDETGWVLSLHNYEKEFFHPDQNAQGSKSAESVMASFQKEFTPASEFKINIFVSTGLIQPVYAVQQQPLQISNIIWHPPTNC
jgi:hypothetical protein